MGKLMELYESGQVIYYLDPNTISKINTLLDTLTIDQVIKRYDYNELNENGIYPEQWREGNSLDEAFNEHHIEEGVKELKDIFQAADLDGDFILVFVG